MRKAFAILLAAAGLVLCLSCCCGNIHTYAAAKAEKAERSAVAAGLSVSAEALEEIEVKKIPPTPVPTESIEVKNARQGREIADYALQFIGAKYKYGGKSPETGFDCSGFVYYVYAQFGYNLERVANDQARQGSEVAEGELMAGDLIAFYKGADYVGHVGIYVGDGWYVHAAGEAYGVVLTSLDDPDLKREYTARRLVGCEELLADSYTRS